MIQGLAPMDGITDCAYRVICKEIFDTYRHKDDTFQTWTEFMSADGYAHSPTGVVRHLQTCEYDNECIAQIFGGNKETLVSCAQHIDKTYSFGGIELNMGCPSPKIMKCEAGSGMLKNKQKTLDILKTISQSITAPFSLKTRVGLTQHDVDEQFEFLIEASKYVCMIGVHGRLYKQGHNGEVNRPFIRNLKERLPQTTIIGNGGIRSFEQAKETNGTLDGIMTAQSAIGNPRIFTPHSPSPKEKCDVILKHLKMSVVCEILFTQDIETYDHTVGLPFISPARLEKNMNSIDELMQTYSKNIYTPVQFRKYLYAYVNGLPDNKSLKKALPKTKTYEEVRNTVSEWFDSIS